MTRSHRSAPTRPVAKAAHRQRGVAAVVFAVATVALVTMVMFGFNVGQLYFAQRDLERQAALAALAGAQVASGCRAGGVPGSQAAVQAAVLDSLAVNAASGSVLPTSIVDTGRLDRATSGSKYKLFVTQPAGSYGIDSARVYLTRLQPAVIAATLFGAGSGSGTLSASATATQLNTAEFAVGTGVLNLDTNQSALLSPLLQGLLGSSATISAVSYQGLAQAHVSLANLMVAAGVTNLHDLLAVSTNLRGALGILSTALSAGVDTGSVAASSFVATLGGQTYATGAVSFGDVIGSALGTAFNPVVSDAVSAVPFVNGAELLMALAQDAAASRAADFQIQVPLALQIPGVIGEYLFLQVIHPASFAVGPIGVSATNAQLKLKVRLQLSDKSNLLGLLLSNVLTANVALDLDVASGSGTLTKIACPSATVVNPATTIGVDSKVANLTLGAFSGSASTAPPVSGGSLLSVLSLLNLNLLTVDVAHSVMTSAGSPITDHAGPFTAYGTPTDSTPPSDKARIYPVTPGAGTQVIGSKAVLSSAVPTLISSLTANGNLSVSLLHLIGLGPSVSTAANAVNTLLLSPLTSVLDVLLDSVLKLLGIQIGTVTIDLRTVTIGSPVITNFCSPSKPCSGVPNS